MSVIFTTGSFETEVGAVLLGEDGSLRLMALDGSVGALSFDLPALQPAQAARLKIWAEPNSPERMEVYSVAGDLSQLLAVIEHHEFLYPWRQDEHLALMRAEESQERAVSLFEPGQGWSGGDELRGLVIADATSFRLVYGGLLDLAPAVAPLGPRSRPSGVAERV